MAKRQACLKLYLAFLDGDSVPFTAVCQEELGLEMAVASAFWVFLLSKFVELIDDVYPLLLSHFSASLLEDEVYWLR